MAKVCYNLSAHCAHLIKWLVFNIVHGYLIFATVSFPTFLTLLQTNCLVISLISLITKQKKSYCIVNCVSLAQHFCYISRLHFEKKNKQINCGDRIYCSHSYFILSCDRHINAAVCHLHFCLYELLIHGHVHPAAEFLKKDLLFLFFFSVSLYLVNATFVRDETNDR